MSDQVSLMPVGADEESPVAQALSNLLDEASATVAADEAVVKEDDTVKAEILYRMLVKSVQKKTVQNVAQSYIVAYLARTGLWRAHRGEYDTLRDFLKDTGLSQSAVSDLNALGTIIVPYCDQAGVPLDRVLTPERWGRFREGIPTLRQAAKTDDRDLALEVVDDIAKAKNRDAVRHKYRTPNETIGHGTAMRTAEGKAVLLVVVDDQDDVGKLMQRLKGVEWDLVAAPQVIGGATRVVIEGAADES